MTIIDLYGEQGSTLDETLSLGTDLTGYTINSKCVDSQGIVFAITTSFLDETIGEINLLIPSYITSNMNFGVGYYDIELTSTDNKVSKPIKGRIYLDKEVTV